MGRATQFIEYINTARLSDKDKEWPETKLTHITNSDKLKEVRRTYQRNKDK